MSFQVGNKNIDNASGQVVRLDIQNTIKTVANNNFGPRNSAGTILPCEFLADDTTNKLLIRKSSGGDQANPNPTSGTAADFFEVGDLDTANLGLLPKSGGTLTGVLQLPTGSVSTPALNVGDSGTGLFKPSSNVLGITADGTKKLTVDATATQFSGNATTGAKIRFLEASNNGNQYVEFKAKDSIGNSNAIFTLPSTDGSNGQALITNGAGELSFGAPITGAANLTGNTLASGVTASSLTSFSGTDFGFNTTPGGTVASKQNTVFIAIGDSDTGILQDGDGQLEFWSNDQEIANFNATDITFNKAITSNSNIATSAAIAATGNITANSPGKFIGDGSALTGLSTLPNAVHARRDSDFLTTSSSYQTGVEVTIDPVQTNSKILVITVGAARGVYSGNSSGQQATAATTIFRESTQVGKEMFHNKGNPTFFTPASQAFLDTTSHGGNTVTYKLSIKRSSGGSSQSVNLREGSSIIVMEVT